jgi:RNA recognition motif-containing protein
LDFCLMDTVCAGPEDETRCSVFIWGECRVEPSVSVKGKGSMNIYVGNLSFKAGEEDIRQAFAAYGAVASVAIIKDKMTGDSRGFGFVEMPNGSEGQAAITALNGKELLGRTLTVNEARPRTDSAPRPGGGGARTSFGNGPRRGGPGGGGDRRGGSGGGGGGRDRGW